MGYYIKALVLGFGWILVLSWNPSTKGWLSHQDGKLFLLHSFFLVVTSVLLAAVFENWIRSAEDFLDHLFRAAVLPFVGCVIYVTFYNVWAASVDFMNTGRVNLHDSTVLYLWGLFAAVQGSLVIVAYGYFCQRFLTMGGDRLQRPVKANEVLSVG